MTDARPFSAHVLDINPEEVSLHIEQEIQDQVFGQLRRRGIVVGLSGGVDSSVVCALAVRALGAERVFGIFMPEADSSPESLELGKLVAAHFGIDSITEDVGGMLESAGCYQRRDDAIRLVIPEFQPGWRSKLIADEGRFHFFSVVVESPDGRRFERRLTLAALRGVVAATNFKQRVRKMVEYYHADRLGYAVAGTPNLVEFDQGFFVKGGDGLADLKPIAHLYKTQVYALARFLGVPEEICRREPTTDTYSLQQSQEEFFFDLPYAKMDLCLYARNAAIPAHEVGPVVELSPAEVERVNDMIEARRRAAAYLHSPPLLVRQ